MLCFHEMKPKTMVSQFSFDKTETLTEDTDSDESYNVDSPLINLNDSHYIRRPFPIKRGHSEDDTFSINLRFKVYFTS